MFYLTTDGEIGFGECIGPGDTFDSELGLLGLMRTREMSQVEATELYNSFAGVVGTFADLKPWRGPCKNVPYGAAAIWKSIQRLVPMEDRIPANEPPDPPATESSVDAMLDVETRKPGDMSALTAAAISALTSPCLSEDDSITVEPITGARALELLDADAKVDESAEPRDPEDMTNAKKLGLTARVSEAVAGIKTRRTATKATGKPPTKTPKAKVGKTAPRKASAPQAKGSGKHRDGTKRARVLAMLERKGGVSIEELMGEFNWLRHSVRGYLSTLGSQGVKFTTERDGKRGHVYKAVA